MKEITDKEILNKEDTNLMINVEIDILFCIHCYFLHSIDDGIRFLNDNNINDNVQNDKYFDFEINNFKNKLSKRFAIINKLRGMDRIKKRKFVTQNIQNYKKGMYII